MFQVIVRDETRHQTDKLYMLTHPVRLLDFLRDHHYSVDSPCGGNGSCGKCLVRMNGEIVHACKTFLDQECILSLCEEQPHGTNPVTPSSTTTDCSHLTQQAAECSSQNHCMSVSQDSASLPVLAIGGAVDLGTTTVEVQIFDLKSGYLLAAKSEWNCQISYGGDVISRISYCMTHSRGLAVLSRQIRRQVRLMLRELMDQVARENHCSPVLSRLVIAGNTAMQHIFAGLDPSSLARAPFAPVTYFEKDEAYLLPEFSDCHVSFVPCISAFVGGDIVSGLVSVMTDRCRKNCLSTSHPCFLFIDIGTNGEMALYKDGFVSTCSVACGPAFEGAAISCGMRNIPGAVRHVHFQRDRILSRPDDPYLALTLDVVGQCGSDQFTGDHSHSTQGENTAATSLRGVCGSGLIDLMALLLREGVIDQGGHLLSPQEAPEYMRGFLTEDTDGNGIFWLDRGHTVGLTASDVRQLQLAKGALGAGIELLLKKCEVRYDQVEQVYLAGNFGSHLDVENMSAIGMIPEQLKKRVLALGNSSLTGAGMMLQTEDMAGAARLRQCSIYLELADDPAFTDTFLDHINF